MRTKVLGNSRRCLAEASAVAAIQGLLLRLLSEYQPFMPTTLQIDEGDEYADLTKVGILERLVATNLERATLNKQQLSALTGSEVDQLPYDRELGSCFMAATAKRLLVEISLSYDAYSLSPSLGALQFSNGLSVNRDFDEVATLVEAVQDFFGGGLFEWGRATAPDEFDYYNIQDDDAGFRAVGMDASRYLPGFYWGNYFGPHLVEVFGRDRFCALQGLDVANLGKGILVHHRLPPDKWRDPDYQDISRRAVATLGENWFFSKDRESGSVDQVLFEPREEFLSRKHYPPKPEGAIN